MALMTPGDQVEELLIVIISFCTFPTRNFFNFKIF